jgi:FG-GAP repeat protein
VFGKGDSATVDLASLGNRGFRIDAADEDDHLGYWVSGAGDVNGDGRADVLVAAWGTSNKGRQTSGSAYVVFGAASVATVDLANLGERGFRIDGAAADDHLSSVAGLGDVNADGLADFAVGAWGADNNGRRNSGSAYVVYGKRDTATVDLAALGSHGFRVDGASEGAGLATSLKAAGDMNGDGKQDLIVGAPGQGDVGFGYVVFGKADLANVDVGSMGAAGFQIEGAAVGDEAGSAVAGAGDVNGDGRPDLVLGATARNNPLHQSGAAFVVFGKADTATVDLARFGKGSFRLSGTAVGPSGAEVAGIADLNGDGRAEVLVASPYAGNNGRDESGSVYVVFGRAETAPIELVPGTAAKVSSSPGYRGSAKALLPTAAEAEYDQVWRVGRDPVPRAGKRSGFLNGWHATYQDRGAGVASAVVDVRVYRRAADTLAAYGHACPQCSAGFDWSGFKERQFTRVDSGVPQICYERTHRRGALLLDAVTCERASDSSFKIAAYDADYELALVAKKATPATN